MSIDALKEIVWRANMALDRSGLVTLTWGNASGIDRSEGIVAIKPSGVPYDELAPKDIVVLRLSDGTVVDGSLKPSSDAPSHLVLYRAFDEIGGIVHTHSPHAVAWAQAAREIPCFGTTHADHFYGPVPVTRELTPEEIEAAYEENSGQVIVEHFKTNGINPVETPAALLPHHGPFAWGATPDKAVENAVALESVALMAILTCSIDPGARPAPESIIRKHYLRKHGPDAYYGQK